MKATIRELFNTGREIVSYDNSEFDRPTTIADLKKCSNVIVDKKDKSTGLYPVMIDDRLCHLRANSYNHIGGKMLFLEIEY